MQLTNTRAIPASQLAVWTALNDPTVLQACIPGCEVLERETEHEWRSVIAARVGPVAVRFKATMTLEEVVPPQSYTLRFDGQGGPAGLAKGSASVTLAEASPNDTHLCYTAKAQVSGKLAQLGSRLIDGVAAKLADEFFARFAAHVASAPAQDDLLPRDGTAMAVGGNTDRSRVAASGTVMPDAEAAALHRPHAERAPSSAPRLAPRYVGVIAVVVFVIVVYALAR